MTHARPPSPSLPAPPGPPVAVPSLELVALATRLAELAEAEGFGMVSVEPPTDGRRTSVKVLGRHFGARPRGVDVVDLATLRVRVVGRSARPEVSP